ncbi:HNH endonuclease [Chromobacterium haemolyticum]|uniref:HNH endonuclease n=1 Tax=Chromobacterium haemolyticum TaxID=394935 RepID=UPI001746D0D6|nr:HNH endonuclease [Chromobacterium haemolyticum]QOD82217.1 HNH endonuclease [Chromobacterium haemolyticum]
MENRKTPALCPLCDQPIALKGDSREHIIPNSIGGRLKIRGFICVGCNSRTGESWDAEIWKQFAQIAMMHGVERDRGEPPSIQIQTVDGNRYRLLPDGSMTIEHPKFSTQPHDNGMNINIAARDAKEARRMARQITDKHPQLDLQTLLNGMTAVEEPLESPVTFSACFGGELVGRSMVKTAVAMACALGIDAHACDAAMPYLKFDTTTPLYTPFYLRDLVAHRPEYHAFNCVSVIGDPLRRTLISYLEYFSLWRVVVILSEKYEGQAVQGTYAFNPANGEPLDLQIDLALSDDELELIRKDKAISDENYKAAFERGFAAIYNRSQMRHWERETHAAFHYACERLGIPKDGSIGPEQWQVFVALMIERLGPFISRMVRR